MGLFSKSRREPMVGLFGKIPVRGDFVAMALPRDLQTRLETWIKAGLSVAQSDPNWREAYMSSPIWQFAFASGFLGDQSWCGVIMPSVDSVGRHFPLVIAMQSDAADADVLMEAQNLAQASLSQDFSDVEAWMGDIRGLIRGGIDHGPERLCAPKSGGVFRVVESTGYVGAELREAVMSPELYSRLIGASGGPHDAEMSLL